PPCSTLGHRRNRLVDAENSPLLDARLRIGQTHRHASSRPSQIWGRIMVPIRHALAVTLLIVGASEAGGSPDRAAGDAAALGIFEQHGDVGLVQIAGSAKYDNRTKSYTITASGDNMWAAKDAFHFIWTTVAG